MKKIIASAIGLALVGGVAVTTASAVESQFGGYWRTRMFFQDNFVQTAPINDSAYNRTDNRTRLYYTAKFNDNFKFVNKFEFNSSWGDSVGGDIGADGNTFVVKNSYADFTLGMVNAKVGIQHAIVGRSFLFDDDFSGAVVTGDFGSVKVPVMYASGPQEDVNKNTFKLNSTGAIVPDNTGATGDTHILAAMPSFMIGEAVKLTPTVVYQTTTSEDTDLFWVGADVDLKLDAVTAWGTFFYNGGNVATAADPNQSDDVSAWLVAAGADAGIVHGQAFYATGDAWNNTGDKDAFQLPGGASYYWSEIMGLGVFDGGAATGLESSTNSPQDQISNIVAFNLGVTFKPVDKLTLNLDAWYAMLDEDIVAYNGQLEDSLGTEIDAKVSYELMDNLNADLIFAYLFAGDATGPEDVMEGGVQLSLSF
ncbi:hypothetical protein FCL47_21090 [Desulfopila sp. IMCC35006]|nr:hypothetical protein FCL47_21090 [Desulfopila sp. IMCC35006]